ncbi:microcin ABC transporter permease [Helicobacter sp. 16-1353]|uniref:microcin C ABC transporter permease YejB n=1 Tax=Helicobacter sp. 16-1353 TaxID=2004996 RepID=UPI000DCC5BC4|nr:microcin C ABC transporter permease YejB [Helicobacter sp. 16-1353]RAX52706.1 microcin ABC transporter permease [Helicobacter sp. 16-1353]
MREYILKRILLLIPTIFGIMCINFAIIQLSPGGPVELMIAKYSTLSTQESFQNNDQYRGKQGLSEDLIKEIEQLYGFDKPILERFFIMIKNYISFDFGESFYRKSKVIDIIKEKLPVSISLGIFSTLLIYLISIPLGIRKAVKNGSKFDMLSSAFIILAYSIPAFLLAILFIILFCGGNYLDIFPLKGIVSDDFHSLTLGGKILDYLWHITLPVFCITIGGFATLTLLVKNSFLDEINKQYVLIAKTKGLSENGILYGHIFRNAMLIVIASFPSAFLAMFFTGSLMIEIIFSLDGLGLLGYESIVNRDYPIVFASLYIFTLLGLIMGIISDLTYALIDPRIDFEKR